MAGIIANSASVTIAGGATSPDNTKAGYLTAEQIALSVTPSASSFAWSLAVPSGSSRATLSGTSASAPTFTPDVAGFYTITVTVDGSTTYVLRCSVVAVAVTTFAQAMRLQPVADASVTAPALGEAVFFSDDVDRLRSKDTAGAVRDIDPGARTGTFTLSSGAATITDSSVTASTVVAHMLTTASSRGDLTFTVSAGVSVAVASSDGSDGSTYSYALIG